MQAYRAKMKISPKVMENKDIMFHAFTNSTEYIRFIQISKLIIRAATRGVTILMRLFIGYTEKLGQTHTQSDVGLTTVGNTVSLSNTEFGDSPMDIHKSEGSNQTQIQV